MDQDAFRETYREVNERACLFEKSILTNRCDCSHAERFCIAEREGVRCLSDDGQQRCARALRILREQTHFALRTHEDKAALPHGKAMRIQVGGMRGIRALLDPDAEHLEPISDVAELLTRAEQQYGDLRDMPYSRIMPHIVSYEVRSKRPRSSRRSPK
ncbi:MAG: hypothetical protein D6720_02255 [Gammaproteobacteria bacterium]|nr:MAG: hypothetical protein D6720_02255 [Gammaproteobacteria bacterium]